jgi:hypothetical protein
MTWEELVEDALKNRSNHERLETALDLRDRGIPKKATEEVSFDSSPVRQYLLVDVVLAHEEFSKREVGKTVYLYKRAAGGSTHPEEEYDYYDLPGGECVEYFRRLYAVYGKYYGEEDIADIIQRYQTG